MNNVSSPSRVRFLANPDANATSPRPIVHRTRGQQHGPITRLVSPSDLGHFLKPFVFLDLFAADGASQAGGFGMHPHSGIATVTYMIEGEITYEDSTGRSGLLPSGGLEYMMAGGGVWHTGAPVAGRATRGFQLWIALPPALETAPARSIYLSPDDLHPAGPASVLLGSYGGATSPIPSPSPMNYLAVHLKAGEDWRYEPAQGHQVAWVAVSSGDIRAHGTIAAGELVIFEESNQAIDFHAESDAVFVLGSAAKHAHELVMGNYSVHTSEAALRQGEAGIREVRERLRAESRK